MGYVGGWEDDTAFRWCARTFHSISDGGVELHCACVGPECDHPISCLAFSGDAVWASSGPDMIKYLRAKEVRVLLPFSFETVLTFRRWAD